MNSREQIDELNHQPEASATKRSKFIERFSFAGAGVVIMGVGIGLALKGDVGSGAVATTFGAVCTKIFAEEGLEEFNSYKSESNNSHLTS